MIGKTILHYKIVEKLGDTIEEDDGELFIVMEYIVGGGIKIGNGRWAIVY